MATHVWGIGRNGPLVDVRVAVGGGYASRQLGGPEQRALALIDTGATMTAISPAIIEAMWPQQVGSVPVSRPNLPCVIRPTFDVRLRFWTPDASPFWFNLEVVESQPVGQAVDVLIGTDLLNKLWMAYDGPTRQLRIWY